MASNEAISTIERIERNDCHVAFTPRNDRKSLEKNGDRFEENNFVSICFIDVGFSFCRRIY